MASVELDLRPASQPQLPSPPVWLDAWSAPTKLWWRHWGESAQAEMFTASNWDVLLETAVIHARFWRTGSVRDAAMLRLRVEKLGARPETASAEAGAAARGRDPSVANVQRQVLLNWPVSKYSRPAVI